MRRRAEEAVDDDVVIISSSAELVRPSNRRRLNPANNDGGEARREGGKAGVVGVVEVLGALGQLPAERLAKLKELEQRTGECMADLALGRGWVTQEQVMPLLAPPWSLLHRTRLLRRPALQVLMARRIFDERAAGPAARTEPVPPQAQIRPPGPAITAAPDAAPAHRLVPEIEVDPPVVRGLRAIPLVRAVPVGRPSRAAANSAGAARQPVAHGDPRAAAPPPAPDAGRDSAPGRRRPNAGWPVQSVVSVFLGLVSFGVAVTAMVCSSAPPSGLFLIFFISFFTFLWFVSFEDFLYFYFPFFSLLLGLGVLSLSRSREPPGGLSLIIVISFVTFFYCAFHLHSGTVPPGPSSYGQREQRPVPSDWREDWQYNVGPRGGRMRRRVRLETRYMRWRGYEKHPDAPERRWPPWSDYPYPYVLGEWEDYTEEEVHPLGEGNWQRIPAPRR